MIKLVVGLSVGVFVAACASPPDKVAGTSGDTVCERYTPTGSNIPRTRCFAAEDRNSAQQDVDALRNSINRSAPSTDAARASVGR